MRQVCKSEILEVKKERGELLYKSGVYQSTPPIYIYFLLFASSKEVAQRNTNYTVF